MEAMFLSTTSVAAACQEAVCLDLQVRLLLTCAARTSEVSSSEATIAPPVESESQLEPADSSSTLQDVVETAEGKNEPPRASTHLAGKINTLFGNDLKNVIGARDFLVLLLMNPLEIAVGVWFLYELLGWAAIVGLTVMIATLPLPGLVVSRMSKLQASLMEKTEERVRFITESLGVVRLIKMFAWEPMIKEEVARRRGAELKFQKQQKFLNLLSTVAGSAFLSVTMIATFAFYASSRVFSSLVAFSILREDLNGLSPQVNAFIQARVSLDRLTGFLQKSALLDRYRLSRQETVSTSQADVIGFHNATFTWGDSSAAGDSKTHAFSLQIEDLVFQNEGVTMITGYLAILVLIAILSDAVLSVSTVGFIWGSIRASAALHKQLTDKIFGTTFHWYSVTPTGRIISRFTQDIGTVDGPLPTWLPVFLEISFSLLFKFGAIVVLSPVFLLPSLFIAGAGMYLGQVSISAQLPVRRLVSNHRSPLYNHFGAAINGLVSIRAYGAERMFKDELFKRLDNYCRPSRTYHNLDRWISVRADVLGALFAASLAGYLLYGNSYVGAGNAGFSLSQAIRLSGYIVFWVRVLNELELSMNGVERIRDYLLIEQEPQPTEDAKPLAYWPASGSIKVENLCASYTENGPSVLHDLTFSINSGERIGIVGRTGSGKSSLALALLRLIPTRGSVSIAGLSTAPLSLPVLRAAVGLIPQEPALVSGTLRSNLDPFAQVDDAGLNAALHAAGLNAAIKLDSPVRAGGKNFSVGERQLVALARAIVRRTKILVLDEATASVDETTDAHIQQFIRAELHGVTLITIAHRLRSIMDYDRIMVLDKGRLVEYDTPLALLCNEQSQFCALVEESGEAERLWAVARGGRD